MEGLANLVFFALLIGVFYFLLIRPQRRRVDEHRKLVDSVSIGDEVVTIGGLYGKVTAMGDDFMELESAPGVRLRYTKTAVHHRVNEKLVAPTTRSLTSRPAAGDASKTEDSKGTAVTGAAAAGSGAKSTVAATPAKSTAKKTAARTASTSKSTAKKTTAKKTTAKKPTRKSSSSRSSSSKKTTRR